MQVTTIGLDIAKHVFQVHGIDGTGQDLIRRQLRRSEVLGFFRRLPPCLIGMEACSTAHLTSPFNNPELQRSWACCWIPSLTEQKTQAERVLS
jgi:transposase